MNEMGPTNVKMKAKDPNKMFFFGSENIKKCLNPALNNVTILKRKREQFCDNNALAWQSNVFYLGCFQLKYSAKNKSTTINKKT
jgi:hypothetical protein